MAVVESEKLVLCHFSRSEVLQANILNLCPLALKHSEHKRCPCKRRKYHVTNYDLRVIECLHPQTFSGETIRDPERFRESIRQSGRKPREKKREKGQPSMSTAVATAEPKANGKGEVRTSGIQTAQVADDQGGIWCGTPIPILGVCGEKGEGKTLMISSIDPEHTAMVDLEDSSASYNIPFARRWNLYDEMGRAKNGEIPKPIECFEWFRKLITEIKPGEFTVLAVDPISDIEQGLVDWVQTHPEYFNHTKNQYEKGAGIMWGDVKAYWKILLGIVSKKVQTFAFTVHMGAVFKGGQPVEGKRKAKGKETLFELASLYLHVERPLDEKGGKPDKPSARVLKSRLAHSVFVDGEFVHKPILPPYMKVATPKAIREFIKNPPDYSKLKKSELLPPEKEMSEEDKLLIKAQIAEDERVTAEANLSRMDLLKKAAAEQQKVIADREQRQAENAARADAASAGAGAAESAEQPPFKSDAHAMLSEVQAAGDAGELQKLHGVVADLCSALQMTADQMAAALAKRGAKRVEDLNSAQAEEMRAKLQKVLNDRQAAAKASSGSSGN